ncbi:PQQ-binding-like beta-propeller repeat protein [Autumnicola psychrophila]|uniref:PQQ-binding-like beta-propeller repeat protein n=1 Tax=Autumnicola psychrophila TaxID=3075592 RepID=A0ABU3DMR5_9FLAO|nr:PQQ-binding-like beta-propeller repeat protein [Zunongwangia sp. F225]MDT0684992.1 PQQ-binding-like beta-propeller repeat protein [Zunongwangia sp. F225]
MALLLFWSCVKSNQEKNGDYNQKDEDDQHQSWKDYGGGPDQSKYVDFNQITRSNVKDLEVAWFYPTGDNKIYQFNPIIVDNYMYVLAKDNSLVALNATTGEEIWIHSGLSGMARRGINYWESKDGEDKRLIFQINNYLQEIDARTGKSILSFGKNGLVDLRQGLGRDPNTLSRAQSGTPGKIFEDLILLGSGTGESYMSSPGYLRAFNVVTGELVWTFHTIPQPGEYGYDTWPKDAHKYAGGVNTWGEISVDEKRGIAYYPLGSPTYDYYGADRVGSNLFGNSILALDIRTGKRIWHFQTVHHDLWDYDLTAAPQLITVDHEGKKIDAVAVVSKNGFVYVFDRSTGEPLWPIEERPVPQSEVSGEQTWPTQPFPTVIPPASRQEMEKSDLNPVFLSKEEKLEWENKWDSLQHGLFMPPSDIKETLAMPGAVGGVNWGNTAANPDKGILYVISINWPSLYERLVPLDTIQKRNKIAQTQSASSEEIYLQNCAACHGKDHSGIVGPSLVNIKERLNFKDFEQILISGRGDMPSFSQLDSLEMKSLYNYLSELKGKPNIMREVVDQQVEKPLGPVVAAGGAPGGLETRKLENSGGRHGAPYPLGVDVPDKRLYLNGWGLGVPYIIDPPWSEIMAYDLNTGDLKWKRPLGEDLEAKKKGFNDTGMLRAQRNGMVVTSTGLLFSTSKDGKIRAFDADNGKELWRADLPKGTEGLPAMYVENGKQYLVVTATSPFSFGRGNENSSSQKDDTQGGYVVFSLPGSNN